MHFCRLVPVLFVTLLLVIVSGCGRNPSNKGSNDQPIAQSGGSNIHEYNYSELHKVADFDLVERSGQNFGTDDLRGKVWIVSFFFSTCKFECSDQNNTIRDQIHEKLAGIDLTMVSITCDPATDTADVLKTYANEFTIVPEKWKFLTGPINDIQAIGSNSFKVIVDPKSHSKRLLMVDKWGRFRDSFEWKEESDLVRLRKVARMLVAEETEPAGDEIVKTRALPESVFQLSTGKPDGHGKTEGQTKTEDAQDSRNSQDTKSDDQATAGQRDPKWPSWRNEEWLTSFEMTNSSGKPFRSSEMLGKVWIANFFFTSCTGACPRLLQSIEELRLQLGERDVTFVSISNDPDRDTPKILKDYRRRFKDADNWFFLTGVEPLHVRAVGSEFFGVHAGAGETHSEHILLVDKWGKVRGKFQYDKPEEIKALRLLIDDLLAETEPPKK